jgi:hypothetical protein
VDALHGRRVLAHCGTGADDPQGRTSGMQLHSATRT